MPENENGLTEFETELLKSFDELNEDIDKASDAADEGLDDFDPEGFLSKGVSHDDSWEEEEGDEDFGLEDEGDDEEDEEKKKKKRTKVEKELGTFSDSSTGGISEARAEKGLRGFKVKPDPRIDRIQKNQVVLGNLLKGVIELLTPTSRQVANLADAYGHLPRDRQDAGRIGGQVSTLSALPEAVTKAVEEVGFIKDEKKREAAIDQAFEKGLLPDGLDNMAASVLYREDKSAFTKTVAPVLIQMQRDSSGQ